MTIQEIHERILFRLNKAGGGYVSHADIDRMLDVAQLKELNFLLGNEREYQAGRPIARSAYGVTRKIHQDLLHLKQTWTFDAGSYGTSNPDGTKPGGVIVLPSNFFYLTSLRDSSNKSIEVVNEDQLPAILDSELIGPSTTNRYAVLSGKGGTQNGVTFTNFKMQLFPEEETAGTVTYLKRPATPKYAYTTSGRVLTYDSANSTQMDWPDHVQERIIDRTLSLIGEHLKEGEVVQINEQRNQTGV